MNILIVDDHTTNRKLLRAQLEAESHAILEAADGVEALRVLERENVEAVISDILMPNMDGYRLCHEVRRSEQFRALPFILYTSTYTSSSDRELATTVTADKYLIKPASTADLINALREAAEQSQHRKVTPSPEPDTSFVMRQYNSSLVAKLEEKNADLIATVEKLERAHARIQEMNEDLERRVAERTAELETRNRELTEAMENVKELSGLLPICGYCKNIRDGDRYWHQVERYVASHSKARFSHGICPDCFEKHVKPDLAKNGITDFEYPDQAKAGR
jgi:CheY-like chemotaxis protein